MVGIEPATFGLLVYGFHAWKHTDIEGTRLSSETKFMISMNQTHDLLFASPFGFHGNILILKELD